MTLGQPKRRELAAMLRSILGREGIRPDEIDRELALMQDLLQ